MIIDSENCGPHHADRDASKLSAAECRELTRWARRKAPELLYMIRIAYLTGQDMALKMRAKVFERITESTAMQTAPAGPGCSMLRDQEREHIRRVLAASGTIKQAALELGIDGSTLWRKRKRYNLI